MKDAIRKPIAYEAVRFQQVLEKLFAADLEEMLASHKAGTNTVDPNDAEMTAVCNWVVRKGVPVFVSRQIALNGVPDAIKVPLVVDVVPAEDLVIFFDLEWEPDLRAQGKGAALQGALVTKWEGDAWVIPIYTQIDYRANRSILCYSVAAKNIIDSPEKWGLSFFNLREEDYTAEQKTFVASSVVSWCNIVRDVLIFMGTSIAARDNWGRTSDVRTDTGDKPLQVDDDLLVVALRRSDRDHVNNGSGRAIDFANRFYVGEHWRTLHKGTSQQRSVKVRRYVKGPADKPLVVKKKVLDVRR